VFRFLSLIPGVHYVYAGIIGALIVGFIAWSVHEQHVGKDREDKIIAASQLAAERAAERVIHDNDVKHAAFVAALEKDYESQHAADLAAHSADAQRVRQLEASLTHALLEGSGGGPAIHGGGEGGTGSGAEGIARLGDTAAELADADRSLTTALGMCVKDRDALTGK